MRKYLIVGRQSGTFDLCNIADMTVIMRVEDFAKEPIRVIKECGKGNYYAGALCFGFENYYMKILQLNFNTLEFMPPIFEA